MDLNNLWGTDIETYRNIFTCTLINIGTGEQFVYEISDRRDDSATFHQSLYWMSQNHQKMVGYNNVGFDYPVLHHFMMNPHCGYQGLYDKAMSIINSDGRFGSRIWDRDVLIPQIDLFLIHHFDNMAKSTSLKMLEFCMRSKTVEDLPYNPGTVLSDAEKDVLIHYNKKDVKETIDFFHHSIKMVEFREELSSKYNRNFMNHNDTKIGKDYFIMELEKAIPDICYTKDARGKKVPRQTFRPVINLADCIFDYVKFDRPEFNGVLNWLKAQSITETKGVFKGLNCTIDGFQFDFGTGGIHGSVESTITYSDDDHVVIDCDVASYYPNLAIANGLYPEHLSNQFCAIYKDVFEQRKQYPKKTHPTENGMLKLALNGVYGDSNNKYSPFYDPQYTMSITLNGQLLLCMLSEKLMVIPELKMVQINTDGLTVKLPRKYLDYYHNICKDWEKLTGLELEFAEYSRMFIRDVNSYIAEYTDGGLKRIGAYEWKVAEDGGRLGWHQNRSQIVVAKVAEKALVYGLHVPTMVKLHPDDYDFMLRTKVSRADLLQKMDDNGNVMGELQRITRYAITTNGCYLNKLSPPVKGAKAGTWKRKNGISDSEFNSIMSLIQSNPSGIRDVDVDGVPHDERIHTKNKSMYTERNTSINRGYRVGVCNDVDDFVREDLDYDYYITEVNKLVEPLINGVPM